MSRFPIRIIVFDELKLIIFVSQGLTLSTTSLVKVSIPRHYISKHLDTSESSFFLLKSTHNILLVEDKKIDVAFCLPWNTSKPSPRGPWHESPGARRGSGLC